MRAGPERNGGDDETRTRDLCRDRLGRLVFSATYILHGGCQVAVRTHKNRMWWVSLWVEINLQICSTAARPCPQRDYKWERPSVSVRMWVEPQKLWVEIPSTEPFRFSARSFFPEFQAAISEPENPLLFTARFLYRLRSFGTGSPLTKHLAKCLTRVCIRSNSSSATPSQ